MYECQLSRDVIGQHFVPAWLSDIANQDLPLAQDFFRDQVREPPDMLEIWPKPLLDSLVQLRAHLLQTMHQVHGEIRKRNLIPALTPESYIARFLPLLLIEHQAVIALLQNHTLYGAPLIPVPNFKGAPGPVYSSSLYILKAPMIREGSPPVQLGDSVWLKQIRWETRSSTGTTFVASIHSINRAASTIILRCDSLFGYRESMQFVVQWGIHVRNAVA